MPHGSSLEPLTSLLCHEAHCLDEQRWEDWLALYTDDARFWMPGWADDHRVAGEPAPEHSLMLIEGRAALQQRVDLVREGLPVSWLPLPRTCHSVSTSIVVEQAEREVLLQSSFNVHLWHLRRDESTVLFGRYLHRLRRESGGWRIAEKQVQMMNARLPTMIDFFCV